VLCPMTIGAQRRRSSTVSTRRKPTARMPRAWAVRNCLQDGPARRGGIDPGVMQDLPDCGRRDRAAGPDGPALHAPVPPGGVVRGDADHELAEHDCRRRPSGTPARIIPFTCGQPPVPGEQRRRGHGERLCPAMPGDQPGQRREPQPAARPAADPADLTRSTAFSCRSTSSPASLDTSSRPRTIRHLSRQRASRQTTEKTAQR
jgi:hypothetical protein